MANEFPLISICIPAYKRIDYLKTLLDSIAIQTFKNYEIIITDDSPDNKVEEFTNNYQTIKNINYHKNQTPLGTPENWNEAIRKATGKWIKLMHDDDWFANENCLQLFAEETIKNPTCSFFFSAYKNIQEDTKVEKTVLLGAISRWLLSLSPLNLFKTNFIGNPSCTLIRRDMKQFYDAGFKWVVDFEYFIRCLRQTKNFYYIDSVLINISINKDQVTKSAFRVHKVEIPENQLMIQKFGFNILRNIFVYDYYWRFYRNLNIRSEIAVREYSDYALHPLLKQMINFQKKIPARILSIGIISKAFMSANYLISLFRPIE